MTDAEKQEIKRRARNGETHRSLAIYYKTTRGEIGWIVGRNNDDRDRRERQIDKVAVVPSVPFVRCLQDQDHRTFRMVQT